LSDRHLTNVGSVPSG